jgi:hypothetical protein
MSRPRKSIKGVEWHAEWHWKNAVESGERQGFTEFGKVAHTFWGMSSAFDIAGDAVAADMANFLGHLANARRCV